MAKNVNVVLALKDHFSAPLKKASQQVQNTERTMKRSFNKIGATSNKLEKSIDGLIKKTLKWGTVTATAFAGVQFKKSMDELGELSEATAHAYSLMDDSKKSTVRNIIKNVAYDFNQSYEEIGNLVFDLKSANLSEYMIQEVAGISSKLAVATKSQAQETGNLLTAIGNVYGATTIKEYQKNADILAYTQKRGKIEMEDMVHQYGRALPAIEDVGISFEEFSSMVAVLTQHSKKPNQALTGIVGLIRDLSGMSEKGAENLEALGINLNDIFGEGGGGFDELIEKMGGLDDDEFKKIFGRFDSWQTARDLFMKSKGELSDVRDMFEGDEVDGSLDSRYEDAVDNIKWKYKDVETSIKRIKMGVMEHLEAEEKISGVLDTINDYLIENEDLIVNGIVKAITDVVDKIIDVGKFLYEHKDTIFAIGRGIMTWYAMKKVVGFAEGIHGVLELILGIFGKAPGKLGLIIAIVVAIGGAVWLIYTNWDTLSKEFPELAEPILDTLESIGGLFEVIMDALEWIGGVLTGDTQEANPILDLIVEFLDGVSGFLDLIVGSLESIIGLLNGDIPTALDGVEKLATGFAKTIRGVVLTALKLVEGILNVILGILNKIFGTTWELDIKGHFETKYNNSDFEKHRQAQTDGATRVQAYKSRTSDQTTIAPAHARGTGNLRNEPHGAIQMNERGGELAFLPDGTMIVPNDLSKQIAQGSGGGDTFIFQIHGNMIGNEKYMAETGRYIAKQVKIAKALA